MIRNAPGPHLVSWQDLFQLLARIGELGKEVVMRERFSKKKASRDFSPDRFNGGGGGARRGQIEYTLGGNLVADSEEFAHFEACMTESSPTPPALLKGAQLLRNLKKH